MQDKFYTQFVIEDNIAKNSDYCKYAEINKVRKCVCVWKTGKTDWLKFS